MRKPRCPFVELTNGLRVANFASPHAFEFEDGNVLEPIEDRELIARRSGKRIEVETANPGGWTDISVQFRMDDELRKELESTRRWAEENNISIVLVSFPTLCAIREAGMETGPFRTVSMVSRTDKRVRIDRFCR